MGAAVLMLSAETLNIVNICHPEWWPGVTKMAASPNQSRNPDFPFKKLKTESMKTDATFHPPFCFLRSIPCGGDHTAQCGEESRLECFTPSTDRPVGATHESTRRVPSWRRIKKKRRKTIVICESERSCLAPAPPFPLVAANFKWRWRKNNIQVTIVSLISSASRLTD